jgi:AraC-like DNA-binding protein
MAKHMIRDPGCSCFFINYGSAGEAYDLAMHVHAFWQMELGTVGRFDVRTGNRRQQLRPGMAVFLPPGTRHGFSYAAGISYLSLKFHAERSGTEPRMLDLRSSALLRALEKALLASASTRGAEPAITDGVLSALFAAGYAPDKGAGTGATDSLTARVSEFVRTREGRYVTVSQVAEAVGYSASHLSVLFREGAGEPLKTFLDRERGRRAAELVSYSDLSFGRIAYELDFRDVFAFSRFFKRIHGRSPRAFRRAISAMVAGK